MLDAVHGYISISEEMKKIIDTGLFQRLGFVTQLTSAQYVFCGAMHTRKSHSIGAMHIAGKYVRQILDNKKTDISLTSEEKSKMIFHVELAALLHDIGHGMYSHSFDSTIYSQIYPGVEKGHDVHRHVLLPYFKQYLDFDEQFVKNLWNSKIPHLSALINGPVSCDRGDFLKRDSYFCGINYGVFDMDRIIANSYFGKVNDEAVLVYDSKIVPSIIQGLSSRLYLYSEIYLHKNVIAAAILIELMILEANKVFDYVERTKNIETITYMNDGSVFQEILGSGDERLFLAKIYATRLYERKLPKMLSETRKMWKDGDEELKFGISELADGQVKWVSRILSKDFEKEFSDSNIYIDKDDKLYSFHDYSFLMGIEISKECYYYERIYLL